MSPFTLSLSGVTSRSSKNHPFLFGKKKGENSGDHRLPDLAKMMHQLHGTHKSLVVSQLGPLSGPRHGADTTLSDCNKARLHVLWQDTPE